jgi:hypothetical protein
MPLLSVRLESLIEDRVLPYLTGFGFDPDDRVVASRWLAEVRWLVDVEVAPWSNDERLAFAVSWGVHVPGLEDALGDPEPTGSVIDACLVHGRLGERPGRVDPRWFEVRTHRGPIGALRDATLADAVVHGLRDDVLPALRRLESAAAVQASLHERLVTRRGLPSDEELLTIRRIAALSAVLGDRANAGRWLDHLERRSASAMAPDVAAARLAPLRQRLAS